MRALSEADFIAIKCERGLYVVGVAGYSARWSDARIAADPTLAALVATAHEALARELGQRREQFGARLLISSGATNLGVPKLAYALCQKLALPALGVACKRAAEHALAPLDYLILAGVDWGDESPVFLRTADEMVVLGGGEQTLREARAAAHEHRLRVTVLRGFGGASDALASADLPGARFVPLHDGRPGV